MKNFNLFLAFLVCSTVAMASSETSAPVASWNDAFNSLADSAKGYVNTICDYTVSPVNNAIDSADIALVNATNDYVVTPVKNVANSVVNFAQPTDKVVEYATLAKNVTSDAVAYPFAHPLKSMVVAAVVYAMYYAYTEHNAAATKKSKN
ncbi:MAG: hypothetical protein Q8Q60_02715 [Candidatus Chromulinivorax sp.]|nr:hypothetical protein [Candidatus Chromulinivorax sp.]